MTWAKVTVGAALIVASTCAVDASEWLESVAGYEPSGSLRIDYFRSSKALDDESDLIGATIQLKLLPELSPKMDGKIEARFNSADMEDGDARATLLEAYLSVRFSKADLRIGKQIVAWGRADGINPTDNLTPRDYTVLLPFEDDQRIGTSAAKLDVYVTENHTLTVFATPLFEPGRIPLPLAQSEVSRSRPPRSFSSTEIGVRLNHVGEGFDWSVSYFHGFSLLPTFHRVGSAALGMHHDRIDVFGADFARNFGRFGVRGEIGYFETDDRRGTDPSVRNAHLFWILGVDRTFLANLNLNVQFFQRRVRAYQDPRTLSDPPRRELAILNALLAGQQDHVENGISFRVSNKWLHDTLDAEVFGIVNLNRGDVFVRPSLTYAFTDHWEATFGVELYDGPEGTQFGSQRANRGVFIETRWSF